MNNTGEIYIDRTELVDRLNFLRSLKHIPKERKQAFEDIRFMVLTMDYYYKKED